MYIKVGSGERCPEGSDDPEAFRLLHSLTSSNVRAGCILSICRIASLNRHCPADDTELILSFAGLVQQHSNPWQRGNYT